MENLDPRVTSPERIVPPEPLPHVSRKALARVKHRMPIPTECRYCVSGAVELVNNREVYGREYGPWPYMYLCQNCGASIGLHRDTDIPLGTLANYQLREARKSCKAHFEELRALVSEERIKRLPKRYRVSAQHLIMTRTELYQWLARKLDIPFEECHWGMFEVQQCEVAAAYCVNACVDVKNGRPVK